MNSSLSSGWTDQTQAGWRVERPGVAKASAPFFAEYNNGHYETVLQRMPAMLHVMDGSGRILSANTEWLKVLGYDLRDVVGRSLSEILPVEARTKLITTIYPRYLVTGECEREEIIMTRKDGSLATVIMSMVAFRGENGRLQKSICLLEDATHRKLAEMTTSRTDNRFKSAFMTSALGIAIISPAGGVQLANPALRSFLKRADIEEISISYDDLIHRDDRGQFLNGMRQLLNGEVPVLHQDIRYMTGESKVMHGATAVSLVKNDKGETEQLIVQVLDITQKRLINGRLQNIEKMDVAGQLAGGLANDFRSILSAVVGNLQLLEGKFGEDQTSEKRLKDALAAAMHGGELTMKLASFARQQDVDAQDIGAHEVVHSLETKLRRLLPKGITLQITRMPGDPRLLIDPGQLEAAIGNIVVNAADAMPDGGKLTIETQPAHLDHEFAALNPGVAPGHYVMISVSDTGRGMPHDMLDKIWQPFFTTKQTGHGAGLGLSTSYGFVRQSGGYLDVQSEIGQGTTVKIYIPRRMRAGEENGQIYEAPATSMQTQSAEPMQSAPVAQAPARKPKILVVEDQEAVRAVACGFLEDFGYDVIEAGDGFEALAKLQEADDIDLMFSDVVMPGGMNGFDLAQAAQSMKPQLKVVHTSGYPKGAMVHQDEPRFREGFIIMKPYRREDLQKIIKDALESQ